LQKLYNLGCKVNQYEGNCLLKKFSGIKDLVIVNTCCVTKEAETKSFKKYRSAIKNHPGCKIVVTGCMCRIYPKKFSGAYQVIDNIKRNELIKNILPEPKQSRYFLKIEDGCTGTCTFCIVSKVREKIESKSLDDVRKEVHWAMHLGYKEIVLVGANIGLYGIEKGLKLTSLLKMLTEIPDLPRIRLSSIEPRFIDSEILVLLKELPICRHFHIAVQSADDTILKKMGRVYSVSFLQDMLDSIFRNFDDVAIGADIIVGFPGEGEGEFLNTYRFVKDNPFTHIHVFPYSPRPNTDAFSLGDPIPHREKKWRLWQLKKMVEQKRQNFIGKLVDKTVNIIVEENGKVTSGLADNYVRVIIDKRYPEGKLLKVRISEATKDSCFGTVIDTVQHH
jgi:threonylcarbamoyladenosine tRNA methylthiotransferase MtaB